MHNAGEALLRLGRDFNRCRHCASKWPKVVLHNSRGLSLVLSHKQKTRGFGACWAGSWLVPGTSVLFSTRECDFPFPTAPVPYSYFRFLLLSGAHRPKVTGTGVCKLAPVG